LHLFYFLFLNKFPRDLFPLESEKGSRKMAKKKSYTFFSGREGEEWLGDLLCPPLMKIGENSIFIFFKLYIDSNSECSLGLQTRTL
jgi:hypothetical protein